LETKVGLKVLGDFTDQTLERELADQELSGFLISPDFSQSDGSRTVTMGLLHASGGGGALSGGLGGQLLPGRLASSGFPGGLLGTCHDLHLRLRIERLSRVEIFFCVCF